MNRQILLAVSAGLNALLLAAMVFSFSRPRPAAPVAAAPSAPAPLPWSEIKSDDIPTYAANLRRAGCPEATVRNIITADVAKVYAEKARQLQAKAAAADLSPQALQTAESDLQRQQNDLLGQALGVPAGPGGGGELTGDFAGGSTIGGSGGGAPEATTDAASSGGGSSSSGGGRDAAAAGPAQALLPVPAVLHDINPNLKLTSQQLATVDQMKQDFVNAVGTGQSATDPAYIQRWETAQQQSDAQFRLFYGDHAFLLQSYSQYMSAASSP